MAFSFKKWIFSQLPDYFKDTDTYKNSSNEGLFERYSRVFDYDADDNILPFINDFLDILVPLDTPRKYLPLLAWQLGDMSQTGTEAIDRRLVAYARSIYRMKGTAISFKALFNLVGLQVYSMVEDLSHGRVNYDEQITYDQDEPALYDTPCPGCIPLTIIYYSPHDFDTEPPEPVDIPEETINLVKRLLCLVIPIDVKLEELVRRIY